MRFPIGFLAAVLDAHKISFVPFEYTIRLSNDFDYFPRTTGHIECNDAAYKLRSICYY